MENSVNSKWYHKFSDIAFSFRVNWFLYNHVKRNKLFR